jgi:hypothetical protein
MLRGDAAPYAASMVSTARVAPSPPAGRRAAPRLPAGWDTRLPVEVSVSDAGGGRAVAVRLEDLSSTGLGVSAPSFPWQAGARVAVALVGPDGVALDLEAIVAHRSGERAGLGIVPRPAATDLGGRRFATNAAAPPTAWGEHPWLAGERLLFTVLALSARGATLAPAGDELLLEGMRLRLALALPGVGARVAVARVTAAARGAVDVTWIDPDRELLAAVASHLAAVVPRATVAALRDAGLPGGAAGGALRFAFVRGAAELDELLSLRLVANQASGRLLDVSDPARTLDRFDADARHLAIRLGRKLVGCVRLRPIGGGRAVSELEEIHPLPRRLWRDGFTEITRLAVHPDHRGADVFAAALRFLFVQHDRAAHGRFYALNCYPEMARVYVRAGARALPGEHYLPFSRSMCRILTFDMPAVRAARVAHPLAWAHLYGPALDELAALGREVPLTARLVRAVARVIAGRRRS